MIGQVKTPMRGDRVPEEIKRRTAGMFRGVHVFVSGGNGTGTGRVHAGERVFSYGGEESIEVKRSEFAGRSVGAGPSRRCA